MKYTSLISVSLIAALFVACSPSNVTESFPEKIDVGTRPESITKGFDGDYFVTVMGEPGPGNAHVARIHNGEVSVFADGMDEPKGIAFDGENLFCTDLRQVWKIDSEGNKSVLAGERDFPKAIRYLNDAALSPDGRSIFVTDMGANDKMKGPDGSLWPLDSDEAKAMPVIGRVYRISIRSGNVSLSVDSDPLMPCPNGVGFGKDGQMLIGAFFQGNLLERHFDHMHVIGGNGAFRGADAVEQDSKGNYYVSSWSQGKVWKMDSEGNNVTVLIEGLQSGADFYLNEEAGMILVPDMLAGTVTRVDL